MKLAMEFIYHWSGIVNISAFLLLLTSVILTNRAKQKFSRLATSLFFYVLAILLETANVLANRYVTGYWHS